MGTSMAAVTNVQNAIATARTKWAGDKIGPCLDEAQNLADMITTHCRRIWPEWITLPEGPARSLKRATDFLDNGPGGCRAARDRLESLLVCIRDMPTNRSWLDLSKRVDDLEGRARGLRKALKQEEARNAATTLDLSEVECLLTAARTAVQTFDAEADTLIAQTQAAINVAAASLRVAPSTNQRKQS